MVEMAAVNNCEVDLSSSDFSVISHPPEDSLQANGLHFPSLAAPGHLPLDEFSSQLQDLLQENAELKGALQKNTAIMRQHFKTLSAWQEKVSAANQRHKLMQEESNRTISEMRRENWMLRTRVRDLLETKEEETLEKGESLLYVDEDAGYTVVHHFPGGESKDDFPNQSNGATAMLESNLHRASSYIQRYNERCNSVDQLLSERQGNLEMYGSDASLLREEIRNVRSLLAEERSHRQEDGEKFEKLLEDHRELLHRWKSTCCEGRQTEALLAIERKQQQEHSDFLTAQLVRTLEELAACRREMEQLGKQVEMLRGDSEQVPILRAQVEIYRQDFEAERQSKEHQQVELEKARQEIATLQLQNAQLTEELSGSDRHHRRRSSRQSVRDPVVTSRERTPEPCPKCRMTFGNVRALQNHIDQCLDGESATPYP